MKFIVSVDGNKPTVLEAAKDISRSKFIELIAETLGKTVTLSRLILHHMN